jgi:glutathione S-transferase
MEAASARGGFGAQRPHLAAWLKRLHERPAYQRALKQGGPYSLMS